MDHLFTFVRWNVFLYVCEINKICLKFAEREKAHVNDIGYAKRLKGWYVMGVALKILCLILTLKYALIYASVFKEIFHLCQKGEFFSNLWKILEDWVSYLTFPLAGSQNEKNDGRFVDYCHKFWCLWNKSDCQTKFTSEINCFLNKLFAGNDCFIITSLYGKKQR